MNATNHADKLAAALRDVLPVAKANALRSAVKCNAEAALAAHEARTFADECREMAERVRAFLALDGAGFSDDFLDGLADDLDAIANKVQP